MLCYVLLNVVRRRGVRAAFMLIPLFGLQLFLTIYRPQQGQTSDRIHEVVFMLIVGSQVNFYRMYLSDLRIQLSLVSNSRLIRSHLLGKLSQVGPIYKPNTAAGRISNCVTTESVLPMYLSAITSLN